MKRQYHISKESEKILSKYFDETGSRTINKIISRYDMIISASINSLKYDFNEMSLNKIFNIMDDINLTLDFLLIKKIIKHRLMDMNLMKMATRVDNLPLASVLALLELYEQTKLEEVEENLIETSGTSIIFE